jgi:integrase
VFAASKGRSHYTGFSKGKLALDKRLAAVGHDLPQWQLHDLRRTARTLMSRARVEAEHAERLLGHAQGEIVDIYDQHAYVDEKADALKKLAGLVSRILSPESSVGKLRA